MSLLCSSKNSIDFSREIAEDLDVRLPLEKRSRIIKQCDSRSEYSRRELSV
jgi:hypothetical protein